MTTNQETKEQQPRTNNTSLRKCKQKDRARGEKDNTINKEARDNTKHQES